MQPDDYHCHRDPADLIDAKLTKDEAEAVMSYRSAREQTKGDVKNLVIVIPVAVDAPVALMTAAVGRMARQAAIDAIRGLARTAPQEQPQPDPRWCHDKACFLLKKGVWGHPVSAHEQWATRKTGPPSKPR